MSAPTLERLYELAPPLMLEAARRHDISLEDIQERFQDWALRYHAGEIAVSDEDHCRRLLRRTLTLDAIDEARARSRRPHHVQLDDQDLNRGVFAGDPLEEREQQAIVRDFLAELPGITQAVFSLTHDRGIGRRRVARHLGITESEVVSRLRFASIALERAVHLYKSGRWCEKRAEAIRLAEAHGANAKRAILNLARTHLESCTACQLEHRRLHHRFTEGALILIPTPAVLRSGSFERVQAALTGLRDWLAGGRARAADTIHGVSHYLPGGPDLGERAFTGTKLAIATLCAAGATTAGVCTLAGVPLPVIAHNTPHAKARAHARAKPAKVKTELASYPHPRLPAYSSTASPSRTHHKTSSSTSTSTSGTKPDTNPNTPPPPAPTAPGATEFGPDTGGTNKTPPPAPADPAAAAIGQP